MFLFLAYKIGLWPSFSFTMFSSAYLQRSMFWKKFASFPSILFSPLSSRILLLLLLTNLLLHTLRHIQFWIVLQIYKVALNTNKTKTKNSDKHFQLPYFSPLHSPALKLIVKIKNWFTRAPNWRPAKLPPLNPPLNTLQKVIFLVILPALNSLKLYAFITSFFF